MEYHSKNYCKRELEISAIETTRDRLAARTVVLQMAKSEQYVDLSHWMLTVSAWDFKLLFEPFSLVYRILCSVGLMTMRGKHHHDNSKSLVPIRKELTAVKQRWCWDINYLRTYKKWIFLSLHLLLDEHFHKAINWLVSWNQTANQVQRLFEGALISENILDLHEDKRSEVINDRGRQMKAKPPRLMLETHQMPQMFARPRIPNDNAFVESAFFTVKNVSEYPDRFLYCEKAKEYFYRFFTWYNTEHYHCGIDYFTPDQCYRGLRFVIVFEFKANLANQRNRRKEINRLNSLLTNTEPIVFSNKTNLKTQDLENNSSLICVIDSGTRREAHPVKYIGGDTLRQ